MNLSSTLLKGTRVNNPLKWGNTCRICKLSISRFDLYDNIYEIRDEIDEFDNKQKNVKRLTRVHTSCFKQYEAELKEERDAKSNRHKKRPDTLHKQKVRNSPEDGTPSPQQRIQGL